MKPGRFARALADYWGGTTTPEWPAPGAPPDNLVQLGEAARRLLEDPVLQLAMQRVQQKLEEGWRRTAPGEQEAREAAYRLYWALEQVRQELRLMLGNAKALQHE